MATRFELRNDTAANWASVNPILSQGEIGLEIVTGELAKVKVGDGSTAWNDLLYITNGIIDLSKTMGVMVHGLDTNATRPVGYAVVTWIGSVEPVNMSVNDIWEEVTL